MNLKRLIRKGAPIALSVLSCAGVIGTGVMSAKAGKKAAEMEIAGFAMNADTNEKEFRRDVFKCYLPAIGVGALTIGCIAGAHILNKKQQAALLAGQLALAQSYGEYKRAVAERCGEEKAIAIEEQIAVEQCKNVELYAPSIAGYSSLEVFDPQKPMLFQEEAGGTIFESTLSKVIQAEYHLNRNFVLGGEISLKEFYDFLGLHCDEKANGVGWSINDEMYWIDFNHRMGKLSNGETGCIIEFMYMPEADYWNL